MVRLDDPRFIPLREYCHVLVCELPPEGLAIYRGRVDAQANEWLKEGLRRRDRSQLQRVVDELFGGSYADDALFALGEIAMERGEFGAARGYWERISPKLRVDAARPLWLKRREYIAARQERNGDETRGSARPAAWLAYPDTNLDLADVRARLVLVSIMEGAFERRDGVRGARRRLSRRARSFGGSRIALSGNPSGTVERRKGVAFIAKVDRADDIWRRTRAQLHRRRSVPFAPSCLECSIAGELASQYRIGASVSTTRSACGRIGTRRTKLPSVDCRRPGCLSRPAPRACVQPQDRTACMAAYQYTR